jgi:hypothetical protein
MNRFILFLLLAGTAVAQTVTVNTGFNYSSSNQADTVQFNFSQTETNAGTPRIGGNYLATIATQLFNFASVTNAGWVAFRNTDTTNNNSWIKLGTSQSNFWATVYPGQFAIWPATINALTFYSLSNNTPCKVEALSR